MSHDAELQVKHTRVGSLVTWWWTDNRRTVTPTEHAEMDEIIATAEDRYEVDDLVSDETIAKIWMNEDETISKTVWSASVRVNDD